MRRMVVSTKRGRNEKLGMENSLLPCRIKGWRLIFVRRPPICDTLILARKGISPRFLQSSTIREKQTPAAGRYQTRPTARKTQTQLCPQPSHQKNATQRLRHCPPHANLILFYFSAFPSKCVVAQNKNVSFKKTAEPSNGAESSKYKPLPIFLHATTNDSLAKQNRVFTCLSRWKKIEC